LQNPAKFESALVYGQSSILLETEIREKIQPFLSFLMVRVVLLARRWIHDQSRGKGIRQFLDNT
jgi:hypothetical protein